MKNCTKEQLLKDLLENNINILLDLRPLSIINQESITNVFDILKKMKDELVYEDIIDFNFLNSVFYVCDYFTVQSHYCKEPSNLIMQFLRYSSVLLEYLTPIKIIDSNPYDAEEIYVIDREIINLINNNEDIEIITTYLDDFNELIKTDYLSRELAFYLLRYCFKLFTNELPAEENYNEVDTFSEKYINYNIISNKITNILHREKIF